MNQAYERKPFIQTTYFTEIEELLTVNEKMLYMVIKSFSNGCFIGTRELAKRVGVSVGTIIATKKKLIAQERIEVLGKQKTLGGYVDILSVHLNNKSVQNQPLKSSLDEQRYKENKYREGQVIKNNNKLKLENSISYLENLPSKDIKELSDKFVISAECIKYEAEKCHDHILTRGLEKKIKDYNANFKNWLRKHKEFVEQQPTKPRTNSNLLPEL